MVDAVSGLVHKVAFVVEKKEIGINVSMYLGDIGVDHLTGVFA
jgi:hypothetical protein